MLFGPFAAAEEGDSFAQGTWAFTTYGSYAHNFVGQRAKLAGGTMGLGYYFTDHMALNLELSGYHNYQFGGDANIAAAALLLRHHVLRSGRFSLFLDVGGAVSIADHRTPWFGTYYNYNFESGVGATFQLWDNVHLIGGARYFHLSNAALEGPEHNPSINATQGYVGLMFRF